jgi:hypothetical protein
LFSFNGSNGASPYSGLIADANGDLFGTTIGGSGANRYGTVFEIQNAGTVASPVYASSPTVLDSFNGSDGEAPYAGLTIDANGDLFGTADLEGANGWGTVFEIKNTGTVRTPVYANVPTALFSFNYTNGAYPYAGLTVDANGNLFGTTNEGGANGYGTAFEIQNTGTAAAPAYASAPSTLVSFNRYSDGSYLYGGLAVDATGNCLAPPALAARTTAAQCSRSRTSAPSPLRSTPTPRQRW